jgi:hypothetical protein
VPAPRASSNKRKLSNDLYGSSSVGLRQPCLGGPALGTKRLFVSHSSSLRAVLAPALAVPQFSPAFNEVLEFGGGRGGGFNEGGGAQVDLVGVVELLVVGGGVAGDLYKATCSSLNWSCSPRKRT